MEHLKELLSAADEAYLIGMSNKGTYKRACKDAEAADVSVVYAEDAAEVSIGGETCRIKDPLWESTCSCPSRSVCRHLIAAMIWLRAHIGADEPDAEPESPEIPESPETPPEPESEPSAPETPPIPTIPEEEAARIRNSAADSYQLLCDVLRWGLVRLPENLAEHLEAAAVRSHAMRMADAEQMLRSIGTRLEESRERRAVFRTELLLRNLCHTAQHLEALQQDMLTEEMLGQFRKTYIPQTSDITILPVGQREVKGGDYEGMVYYFLNLDEQAERRFLTLSDLRPVFYDTVKSRRPQNAVVWNMGIPIRNLMKSKMTLRNAKISGDKLSTSQETLLMTRTKADLNCEPLQNMICTDFREIIHRLAEHPPELETDRMFFIHPAKCLSSTFDTHTQQFRMAIADRSGNSIEIRVRYQAERKKFIEELERIGDTMLNHPENDYVWLCTAQFEEGSLTLFPIEMYDFITVPADKPSRHLAAMQKDSIYAPVVLSLAEDAQRHILTLLQSGLQSARSDSISAIAQKAGQYGMQGFSELLQTLADRIEGFRHASEDTTPAVLHALAEVQQYTELCRQKLECLCALGNMQQEEL